jgi:hypothetical protein
MASAEIRIPPTVLEESDSRERPLFHRARAIIPDPLTAIKVRP